MTRTMLSGLAAVAVLAMLTDISAEAQQLNQRNGLRSSHSGGINAALRHRSARPTPQRIRRLSSGKRKPSANTAASVHALTVYLQWRKCLDNMLPKCP